MIPIDEVIFFRGVETANQIGNTITIHHFTTILKYPSWFIRIYISMSICIVLPYYMYILLMIYWHSSCFFLFIFCNT